MSEITSSIPEARRPHETPPTTPPSSPTVVRPRVWPAILIIAALWAAVLLPVRIAPDEQMVAFMLAFMAPMGAAALLAVWWVLLSRIPWSHRLLGLVGIVGLGALTYVLADTSLQGMGFFVFALPYAITGIVVWLALTPFLRWPMRFGGLLILVALAGGFWSTLRFDGTSGEFAPEFSWRWSLTPEQRFLADIASGKLSTVSAAPMAGPAQDLQPGDWPAFRGPKRDSGLSGVRIPTDWSVNQPRELWRRPVGPGWSSFAVIGNRLYTQEQRGTDELILCYDATNGAEVWVHKNPARFSEELAGPGPRATPTFHDGKVYALGATGILDCLDATTGESIWSKPRNLVDDTGAKLPPWGFASSPLVWHGIVTVFAGGPEGKSLIGYDAATGEVRWTGAVPDGAARHSYCSPHPATIDGVEQILITSDAGVTAFDPKNGTTLWHHDWKMDEGLNRVCQPAIVDGNHVLIGTFFGLGMRRIQVSPEKNSWRTKEVWTTRAVKPYYNDFVVHKGNAYGFDGAFFFCLNLADGKVRWKTRGYGNGQVLLLPDQDGLLILSEQGEVALVEASPKEHIEIGRFEAMTAKTWNHPVVAHGKLYVRNGEEAVCFELIPAAN